MKRKLGAMLLVLLLVLLMPLPIFADGGLVYNADFSELDASGLPVGWVYSAWTMDESVSTYWTEQDENGNTCVRMENFSPNDARLEQEIKVKGNTTYRISARMKAEGGDPEKMAANLSVSDTFAYSASYADTYGEWMDVELYGKTTLLQSSITIALRMGFYGEENVGSAWFDDVRVEAVDEVPVGFEVFSLKDVPAGAAAEDETEGADWIPMQTFVACMFVLLLLAALYRLRLVNIDEKKEKIVLVVILIAGAVIRVYLGATNPGYGVDVNCFTGWGQIVANVGPAAFYDQGFCDYPPGYLYVLGLEGLIGNVLGLAPGSGAYLLLIKLPPMACDLIIAYLLYKIGKRYGKATWALLGAAAYAFMPAVLLDSAMWGQMDSVLTLLMLLVTDAFLQKKHNLAAIWYGVALMVKPQALMLGTILLGGYVLAIMEDPKQGVKKLLMGIVLCLSVAAVIAVPFIIRHPVGFIFEKYFSTLSSYPYATVNALNLFYALGGNWVAQETTMAGLSYSAWGTIGMLLSVALALVLMFRGRDMRAVVLATALMLVGVFCLGVRMHERYMYPALMLMVLAALLYRDKRLWMAFAGLSVTNAVNIYIVLQNDHVLAENHSLGIVMAVLNLIALFYLIETSVDLCFFDRVQPVDDGKRVLLKRQVLGARLPDAEKSGDRASFRMIKKDYLLMAALTLVYAVTAFWQLGDTVAPQTLWEGVEGDYAVVDLGETSNISQVCYYGEIPYGDFDVSFSEDGVHFTNAISRSVGVHDMFKWHTMHVDEKARYIRFEIINREIKIFEIGVFGAGGEQLIAENEINAELLCDEQSMVPAESSYMNSMYFDEVYHGRTAYEQNLNMEWYENTHPPLGKVFMSWSILAFGMTPFGWRFAGTLTGVLMVPVMYLLCKLMFRKELLTFLGAYLMTFDFMHLAQTRLGTIDSYPVLFIMLGFYCMLRYAYMSFYHDKLWKTFVPLFFSGLFMGLGMASKWIGCYAAIGLAVLFFCIFVCRVKEYCAARSELAGKTNAQRRAQCEVIIAKFPKAALWTILSCVVFFVIIPIAIYVGSYYQFLRIDAPNHGLKEVWNYQLHMLNYHKGVFESHPFESSWWQWPLDLRNIWYYVSDSQPAGYVSSISALGNPAVWWMGLAAMVWLIVRLCKGYGKKDKRLWWVLIGFAANYLPWVLVPRITFVYHYFASVPFIILATVLFFEDVYDKFKWGKVSIIACMAVVGVLYILFYPVLTGIPMTDFHASLLKWLPTWTLF